MLDMRELNGNPKSTRFDVFWDEVAQYLEDSTMALDERRHTAVMHMPIAISVRNLKDINHRSAKETLDSTSTIIT